MPTWDPDAEPEDEPIEPPVGKARWSDPWTSHEAGASLSEIKVRAQQRYILGLLREHGPMTDTRLLELVLADPLAPTRAPSGVRTRRGELVTMGYVEDSGETEKLVSNRRGLAPPAPKLGQGEMFPGQAYD